MPAGRPKAKLDLPDGWQQQILDLYKEGGSDVEVRCLIYEWRESFAQSTFYRWLEEEPEFSITIKKGRELSEKWWNTIGRAGSVGKLAVNPTMWIFNMKNRFKWTDRQATEHTGEVKITKVERTIVEADDTNS